MAEQQFVIFRLHQEEYGIDIQEVNEILLMQEITKYPHSGDLIEGIINLRGKIIPIIDIKKKFYGLPTEVGDSTRIIVISCQGQVLGIIADEVMEVLHLSDNMIDPPPSLMHNESGVKGIGKLENRLVILLDLARTFTSGEIAQIESATN